MSAGTAERFGLEPETLAWIGLVLTTEFLLVAGYVLLLGKTVTDWTLLVVPFVWINVGVWAVGRTTVPAATGRQRYAAMAVAGGYFLLLSYFGGLVGHGHAPVTSFELNLLGLPPGWSPAILYNGAAISVAVLPYKLVGYLALAYLVYATALEAASALLGGVVGVLSCVSCSFPLLAGLATGLVGSGGAVAAATAAYTYLLSTAVFVLTAALLVWRPDVGGWLGRRRSGDESV